MVTHLTTIGVFCLSAMTSSAITMTGAWPNISIPWGIFMTLSAMGLRSFSSRMMPTSPNRILNILLRRAPVQIFQLIIVGIIITVTSLCPIGTRTDKGFKHQTMNHNLLTLSGSIKHASPILPYGTTTTHSRLRKQFTFQHFRCAPSTSYLAIQRLHTAPVRYFIAGVIKYWKPSFAHTPQSNTFIGEMK